MSASDNRRLDLIAGDESQAEPSGQTPTQRPWIGIHFDCCGVYARVFRNAAATAYEGACPRCLRKLRVAVGAEGTAQRIFRAS